jgi:hypothetical protein
MQPTIAHLKAWNAQVHQLRGVHWGTERTCHKVLAVEVEAESLQSCMRHCEDFNGLVNAWLRRGVEVRGDFDFVPDRDALNPVRSGKQTSQVTIRILPTAARSWERQSRPGAASTGSSIAAPSQVYQPRRITTRREDTSRVGPLLLAGVFAAGTIVAGTHVIFGLTHSGIENRRDTIERIDESTRKRPYRNIVLDTISHTS